MSLLGLVERLYYVGRREGDVPALLRAELEPLRPRRILDFGGGTGRIAAALAPALGGHWTVADVQRDSLRAAPHSPALSPVLVPATAPLPFRPSSFDAVLLVDVLHHVERPEQRLEELAELLRPGGRLLLVEFDARTRTTRLMGRLGRLLGTGCRFWTPDTLVSALGRLGLQPLWKALDGLRFLARGDRLETRKPVGGPAVPG